MKTKPVTKNRTQKPRRQPETKGRTRIRLQTPDPTKTPGSAPETPKTSVGSEPGTQVSPASPQTWTDAPETDQTMGTILDPSRSKSKSYRSGKRTLEP